MGTTGRIRHFALVAAVLAGALAFGALTSTARANRLVEITIPDRGGEIPEQWRPRAPDGPPRARVLLPDGYDPAKRYPLLVLLVGLFSKYTDWSDPAAGQIEKTAAGFPGIIVMPEGGDGWYTDWWNKGRRGSPSWESYYLDQVIPQVLERYQIRPERRYHALAGVSMGGFGTAYLGGRVPGFFGSVAVFSGLVDLSVLPGQAAALSTLSHLGAGAPPDAEGVFGPLGGFYELGHNPVELARNMGQTRVFVATGDGTPTPESPLGLDLAYVGQVEEAGAIRPASDNYAAALRSAGIDVTYQRHGGFHDWRNFRQEFRDAVDWGLFRRVDEHAKSWVNDTVATRGKLWEFAYQFDAPPDRVVRFERDGRRLFVGPAGSPVNVETDGGCVFHEQTPAVIRIPLRACEDLRVQVRPHRLPAGHRTRVRVAVTPAVAGLVVRAGSRRVATDAAGVAYITMCAGSPGGVTVSVRAPGFDPARVTVPVRGQVRTCRSLD